MRPLEIEYLWGRFLCRVGAHRMRWVTIPFTTFTAPVCTRPGCHTRGMVVSAVSAEDAVIAACAWSDYRRDYGVSSDAGERALEHRAFLAGWEAGRHGDQSGVLR